MANFADLAFLACPVGMGAMMWMMMRPNKSQNTQSGTASGEGDELQRLRQEVEQLKAANSDRAEPRR